MEKDHTATQPVLQPPKHHTHPTDHFDSSAVDRQPVCGVTNQQPALLSVTLSKATWYSCAAHVGLMALVLHSVAAFALANACDRLNSMRCCITHGPATFTRLLTVMVANAG